MEIQNFIFNNENYCQMNQEVKTCCQGVQMAFTGMKSVSLLIKYFPFFLLNWYRNCQGCILKPLCNIFFQIEKRSLVPPRRILSEAKTQKKKHQIYYLKKLMGPGGISFMRSTLWMTITKKCVAAYKNLFYP